jgi:hypothetical protein
MRSQKPRSCSLFANDPRSDRPRAVSCTIAEEWVRAGAILSAAKSILTAPSC